ncbi:MAG: glycosyltransferase family 2 protein [Clostridia bacterium]|jgi:glycosyltransferase involved in cell wall biosynthesis|nr:glycosyltransferase family 2 protein [Clostridia bacterium]
MEKVSKVMLEKREDGKKDQESLQILISTINIETDEQVQQLVKKMNIKSDYLVVNQVKQKDEVVICNKKVITLEKYGLSCSRNVAIKQANTEIIMLADDDVSYVENYNEIIKEAYRKNPKVDMICFWIESKNKERKVKRMPSGKVGYLRVMRICSFQISMKRDNIKDIYFDERFGSGSKYDRGEEGIFLCDCLRKGLKIKFINQKIGTVDQKESTWYKGFPKEYFEIQGKVFKRMYPKFYVLIIIQFAIRKYHQYRKQITFKQALKAMLI